MWTSWQPDPEDHLADRVCEMGETLHLRLVSAGLSPGCFDFHFVHSPKGYKASAASTVPSSPHLLPLPWARDGHIDPCTATTSNHLCTVHYSNTTSWPPALVSNTEQQWVLLTEKSGSEETGGRPPLKYTYLLQVKLIVIKRQTCSKSFPFQIPTAYPTTSVSKKFSTG